MNNQQLYLAWLRTYSPTVYMQAIKRATGRNRNLGGLTQDLVSSALAPNLMHSFLGDDSLDEIDVTAQAMPDASALNVDAPTIDLSDSFDSSSLSAPSTVAIDTSSFSSPASSSSSSTFANVLTAVTALGAGVLQATNQSKLIALNTTRAQQGLPPVNANGQVVSTTGLATTNAALSNFERAITGGGSGMGMLGILALLGLGGYLILKKRSAT